MTSVASHSTDRSAHATAAQPGDSLRGYRRGSRWPGLLRECLGELHREIRLAFTPSVKPEKWVFIVGCYNSGTELLMHMLGSHPSVASLPDEGQFLTDQFLADYELGLPRMWTLREELFRLNENDQGPDARRLKKEWLLRLDRTRPLFLEKSPPNAARTRWLQKNFENAHFIAVVRNGYAVAEGIRRKAEPHHLQQGWPLELCARQWQRSYEVLLEDSHHLDKVIWLRYEDLTANPAFEMKRITDFLGVQPLAADAPAFDQTWSVHEKREVIRDMNAESISRLSSVELETVDTRSRVDAPALWLRVIGVTTLEQPLIERTPHMAQSSQDCLTILHITAPAAVGGLESVVHALATGHRDRGHVVHVAAAIPPDEHDHPFLRRLANDGIQVHPIAVSARSYKAERASVAALCRSIRPSVVHTHGFRSDVVDGGIARRLGIATVSTVHGFTRNTFRDKLYEWVQRRALRRFDAVVAVSQPQVGELVRAGVSPKRVHLLRNAWRDTLQMLPALTAREYLGVSPDAFHVGWVGRLSKEKGADVLVDAVAQLADLPIVVSMMGDGRESAPLQAQARARGCADRFRWHGLVPSATQLFSSFDLLVLSSRTEGTPIVLLEAMAAQVPIVATAVGGVPDVLSSSEAVLVPADNPTALAAAIRDVHALRAAATARAAAARTRLEQQFAAQPWLAAYEQLYRLVVSTKTGLHA